MNKDAQAFAATKPVSLEPPIASVAMRTGTTEFVSAEMESSLQQQSSDIYRYNMNKNAKEFVPSTTVSTAHSLHKLFARSSSLTVTASEFVPDRATMNQGARVFVPAAATSVKPKRTNTTQHLQQPCRFFAQGTCKRGSSCLYRHTDAQDLLVPDQVELFDSCKYVEDCLVLYAWAGNQNIHQRTDKAYRKDNLRCRFFAAGACSKGRLCPYSHDTTRTKASTDSTKNLAYNDDEYNLVGNGIRCIFRPGADVVNLMLHDGTTRGIDTITVSGIDLGIADSDIERVLSKAGPITNIKRKHESYAFVKFDRPEDAEKAITELNGFPIGQWMDSGTKPARPKGHHKHHHKLQKPGGVVYLIFASPPGAIATSSSTFKLMWYAPSQVAWAHFRDRWAAERTAKICNGVMVKGRTLQTKFQLPKPRQTTSFSVWFGNVPEDLSKTELAKVIQKRVKANLISVTMGGSPFRDRNGGKIVSSYLEKFGKVQTFSQVSSTSVLKRKAIARFVNPKCAKVMEQASQGGDVKVPRIGKLFLERLFSAKLVLFQQVYEVIKSKLDEALSWMVVHLEVRCKRHVSQTSISLVFQSKTPKSIAIAKGKIKAIITGHCLKIMQKGKLVPLWHTSFGKKTADSLFASINSKFGIFALRDNRRCCVEVFGESGDYDRIKERLLAFLESEYSVPIPQTHYQYVVHGGRRVLDDLMAKCSARSVSLDLRNMALLVTGINDAAIRLPSMLTKMIARDAAKGNTTDGNLRLCPVCFCEPDGKTVSLGCDHEYCEECFAMFSDQGQACTFPLSCLSEGCGRRIQIDELITILGEDKTMRLLRTSVDSYVRKNLTLWQFCIVPDCDGIYRRGESRVAFCSNCGMAICTTCKDEEHEGLSCNDYQVAKLPPDSLRNKIVEEILTLACPRCSQAFVDFEGCFSIRCSACQCSFCGWCLADCGSDAHPHVLECKMKHKESDSYFGSKQQFDEVHQLRRNKALVAFLKDLTIEEREKVTTALENDLMDLGLTVPAAR